MKTKFTLLATIILLSIELFAQAPQKINYQAVARDLSGNPLMNTPISVLFEIRQSTSTGVAVYRETHAPTTNQFGLFNLAIGGGTPTLGTFSGINWSAGVYFLYIEVNGNPMLPATQLLSVPYALHANTAATGMPGADGLNCWDTNGNGVQDPSEDVNGDLVWDALDCQGDTGLVGPAGINGTNGTGVTWLGTLTTNPAAPNLNDAYYNSTSGISYIWDGTTWQILAQDGVTPTYTAGTGISIVANTISNTGDLSPTNEIQALSISNDTIYLSGGGFVVLPTTTGDNWGADVVNTSGTNITGDGTVLNPLMVADSINDADSNPTNEIQALSISNDTIYLSGGGFVVLPTTTGDNWGTDIVNTSGTNITGDGTVLNPLVVTDGDTSSTNEIQTLSLINTDSLIISGGNGVNLGNIFIPGNGINISGDSIINIGDADNDPTNEIELPPTATTGQILTWNGSMWVAQNAGTGADNWGNDTVNVAGTNISGSGTVANPLIVINNDNDSTNEIQNLSIAGNIINISGGTGTGLSTTAPITGDYLYWNGTNWIAQTIPAGSDNQNLINGGKVGNNQTINIVNGTGVSFSVADADSSKTNEIQDLSFTTPILSLSGSGVSVDLSALSGPAYTAGTGISIISNIVSNTNPDQTVTITGSGATSVGGTYPNFTVTSTDNVNDADSSITNEIQDLSFTTPILSLSGSGVSVDLSALSGPTYTAGTGISIISNIVSNTNPDQTVTITGSGATFVVGTYPNFTVTSTDNVNDADSSITNEIQDLSFTTPILSLSGSGVSVDLSALSGPTYTAGTGISIISNIVSNTNPDQTVTITGSGAISVGGTYPNFTINSPANTDNQDLTLTGNSLGLTNDLTPVDLTPYLDNTDAQNLSSTSVGSNRTINISGGTGTTINIDDADANPTNEIQTLTFDSISGNLTIAPSGNTINLNSLGSDGDWTVSGLDMYNANLGNVGIGTNLPQAQLHINSIDTIAIYTEGTNAFGTFNLTKSLVGAYTGQVYTSGADTVFQSLEPANQSFNINYQKAGGHIGIRADTVKFGGVSANVTTINEGSLHNLDTIFTTGLYVGDNAFSPGDVLTNMGGGRAQWQAPPIVTPGWNLTGNAGTNAATNFIGTTDNISLTFKTNNTSAMTIAPDNTIGIGTTPFAGRKINILTSSENYSMFCDMTYTGSNLEYGIYNRLTNSGTGTRYGVFNYLYQTSSTSTNLLLGTRNYVNTVGSGTSYGIYNLIPSTGSGSQYGSYNSLSNAGTGTRYGNYNYLYQTANTATNNLYGNYTNIIHTGTGIIYGDYIMLSGANATKYGIYVTGENKNYFSGNVGIGTTTPFAQLDVKTTTIERAGQFVSNFSSAIDKYGIYALAQGAGTGINYGAVGEATGSTTNIGVQGSAFGGTTNWAGYFASGDVYIQNKLGIGITPTQKLDVNGNIKLSGVNSEVNKTETGLANLLPIAYGNISSTGVVNTGTGNISVSKTSVGNYTITITGETYFWTNYITNVTLLGGSTGSSVETSSGAGNLYVRVRDVSGVYVDAGFQFIVYKP